jgi:hypothetical protein
MNSTRALSRPAPAYPDIVDVPQPVHIEFQLAVRADLQVAGHLDQASAPAHINQPDWDGPHQHPEGVAVATCLKHVAHNACSPLLPTLSG